MYVTQFFSIARTDMITVAEPEETEAARDPEADSRRGDHLRSAAPMPAMLGLYRGERDSRTRRVTAAGAITGHFRTFPNDSV